MTSLEVVGAALMVLLGVHMFMALLLAVFGNDFLRFMERSYTSKPKTGFDEGLNLVFYVLYGIPHYFYVLCMKRTSHLRARFLYVLWMVVFIVVWLSLFIIIGITFDTTM